MRKALDAAMEGRTVWNVTFWPSQGLESCYTIYRVTVVNALYGLVVPHYWSNDGRRELIGPSRQLNDWDKQFDTYKEACDFLSAKLLELSARAMQLAADVQQAEPPQEASTPWEKGGAA